MAIAGVRAAAVNARVSLRSTESFSLQKKQKADGTDGPDSAEAFRNKAADNDWKVLEESDVLPPVNNLDPSRQDATTITYEYEGTTYAVSEHLAPFKYSALESKLSGMEISQTDNNIEIEVPESEATDFMNAVTTEDGKTVGELFHDNMKEAWSELDISDPRRQYYELLQAKGALIGGYGFLPYQTELGAFGHSDSTLYHDPTIMDQASTYGLLNEKEISNKLAELSQNEQVMDGIDGFMQEAVDKIENKDELVNKIYEAMNSPEYMEMLEGMEPDGAKARFANDLKSLEYLDKQKAEEIRSKLLNVGLIEELSSIVESGDYSDLEALETAVRDLVKTGLKGAFYTTFGIGFADAIAKGNSNMSSYNAAVDVATKAIVDSIKENGKFDIKDVSSRLSEALKADNPNMPSGARNGTAGLLSVLMKNGFLGSLGGILATTYGAYTLNKNMGDTTEERLGAARMFLITLSTSPAFLLAGTKALEKIFDKPGMATMLGLENNTQLREAYLNRFSNANKPASAPELSIELDNLVSMEIDGWADDVERWFDDIASGEGDGARFVPLPADADVGLEEIMEGPNDRITEVAAKNDVQYQELLDELSESDRTSVMGMVDDRISNMGIDPSSMSTTSKLRLVGSVLSTVGGIADVAGGILDIALSAMNFEKLANDPNATPAEFAATSFQLLVGVTFAGAAGTSLASMLAGPATAAALGIASGALGIAGIAFGAIAMIITGVIAKQKQDQAAEDVRQDFRDWSTLGVTEDDWGDKLNYTIHSRYEYNYWHGSDRYYDLYPEDTPVWEARPEQYEDFTEYVEDHGNISDDWFKDWDNDHDSGLPDEGTPDPSGLPRFGDDGEPGDFGEFKLDIDRVDVGSIELAEDGRVIFTKDGVKQVIDPLIGGEAGDDVRQDIVDYLTDLYQISHPDGKADQDIIDRITDIHDESDRFNEIDDLKRALDDSLPPLLGKDGKHSAGTFDDFKEDIDRVGVGSIELDPTDSNSIYFVKDGTRWQLDKDNHGSLSDDDANNIFDYLKNLYTTVHPDGDLDSDLVDRITDLHNESDDFNDLNDLREELGMETDPTGYPVFGEDGFPGTFGNFKEDIDRVDVASIELMDDGRVIFIKDGVKQIINTSEGDEESDNDTRKEIIGYLKGLHELTHPDGEFSQSIADEMNDVFGKTDIYNDLEAIEDYVQVSDPVAWNENPDVVTIFGDSGDPGNFGDFRTDMDKVDVASIRILDQGDDDPSNDRFYFKKSGEWYVLTPEANSEIEGEFDDYTQYLRDLYDITHDDGVLNKRLASQIDDTLGRTDDYNKIDDLKEYLGVD
ncbi:hypothetical protein SAMN05661010_03342 [Modicisalibacter muralis]|uniref:Uncharacterized protein n=1 Tax=Modicisalibacter muralis TaxID=119000 RepID=A0A1G9QDP8_9GAMM|nr:hypothetical protein [Halomonas muralis]SDM09214.1 hypothetical protein SAMN05661010_03342 [Halomonas muralis]